ncbi:MAG: VOC family protein [Firmicutes bacterium]|jgi:methylmalonyl-CoA/ethylmalonyl-CoA epimerase|nr:VOC family protein [Bacillota bacterium]
MKNSWLETDLVAQIGIIVRDIEQTAEAFAGFLGVDTPAWSWTDGFEKAQTRFRGEPSEARAKLAFFQLGNIEIELIEPDHNPSTWREYLDEHGEGVHHIAFVIKDMKGKTKRLEEEGISLIQKGEYEGGRYAYFDSVPQLKVLLELLEND